MLIIHLIILEKKMQIFIQIFLSRKILQIIQLIIIDIKRKKKKKKKKNVTSESMHKLDSEVVILKYVKNIL
jgi:hypothetical protein